MSSPTFYLKSKWCALAVAGITLLALAPQIHFWLVRGSNWHGAYTILQPDELLYSAYVNALIDGRPRRNDPVSGRDDHPQAPLPESLFSIQFIPSFAIALPARALGISASTAFIVLMGLAGALAGLSVCWLLASVTGDSKFAAIGSLVVLCFGALAGGQGLIGLLLNFDARFLGLPFLRSYEPSAPFPLFFVFCAFIWRALTAGFKRSAIVNALLAGVVLATLIFSYFYLWTPAVAWFVCVAFLWLVMRAGETRLGIKIFVIASLPIVLALGFYIYLLSHVPSTLDKHILDFTRRLDLLRMPEIIGALILIALVLGVRQNKISSNSPQVIFAASFALLPFLVFNQQFITGRSVQPFHYEILIANYAVLIGLVLVAGLVWRPILLRRALLIAVACVLWGAMEVSLAVSARNSVNIRNDEMVPVLLRLKERARYDGTWEGLRTTGQTPTLVFSPEYWLSGLLPTWAPHGSLLAPGSVAFQGLSQAERKERLYTHLYYCNRNEKYLLELLYDRLGDPFGTYYVRSTIFGPERGVGFLSQDFQPIRQDEIKHEVEAYKSFAMSFSRDVAVKRPLGYAVMPADSQFDFSHIDMWYERDAGQRVGNYTLYLLKLRE